MKRSQSARVQAVLFLMALIGVLALVGSLAQASATFTFTPAADSYVQADVPTSNFGTSVKLRADSSPVTISFLRFVVSGTNGTVTNVSLKLFATAAHSVGYDVYKVNGTPPTFTETGLNFNNAPTLATTKIGSSGPLTINSWSTVDVTSAVTGDGTYEFGLKTTSATALALSSKEAGANAPQLVVTTTGSISPPTNTALPVISGLVQVGQTVTTSNGTWTGAPTGYGYQWRRCTDASNVNTCSNIGSATAQSYTLTSSDLGKFMRVDVRATNGGGSTTATSDATGAVQATSTDPFVMAAGDIACGATSGAASCQQLATSNLVVNANPAPAAVLPLGDVQYECGETADFTDFYDPSWGRVKSLSKPVVGNHEYITTGNTTTCRSAPNPAPAGAAGYFGYFGNVANGQAGCTASCPGYYSYDIGNWHLIALNSNCIVVSCNAGQPQETWLQQDLAANTKPCTLAYFHHPRYASGGEGDTPALQPLWADLYAARVDLVLVGHDHDYERFDRLGKIATTTNGIAEPVVDPNGMRQIVIGTGGRNHTQFTSNIKTGSQVRNSTDFGVIKVTLHPTSYDWQFLSIPGGTGFSDTGGPTGCRVANNVPLDTESPGVPGGLGASSSSQSQIDVSWSIASDNVGVGGYEVFRDGVKVGTTSGTTFSDTGLQPGTTHSYTVDAFDAAGNTSAQSGAVQATTQGTTPTTVTAAADAYVSSSAPTTNYGSATTIRVDGASPIQKSYLKFTLTGLSGAVSTATLRVWANGSQGTGYDVYSVADTSWVERNPGGITYNTAPAPAGTPTGSSGRVTGGTWTSVNVTPLVTGNGTYSFALATTSSTGLSMSSREGAHAPELVVSTTGGNTPPTANPVSVNATTAVSTPWSPSVSDPDGDPLTCSIVTPPAHGTATVAANCGSGTYQSNASYTGPDPFTYKVNDTHADSTAATVSVTVASGGGGGGPPAFVQEKVAGGNTGTIVDTLTGAAGTGHTLVALVALAAGSSASVTTVTDSASGTWTKGPVGFLNGVNSRVEIWYRLGISAPVTSVTVTLSAAKSASLNVSEWSGVATTSAVDASLGGSAPDSTTVTTPGPFSTTNAVDVVIGAVNYPLTATATLGAGSFTSLAEFNFSTSVHGRAAYRITSATGSQQASWTLSATSGGNGGAILALKGA